MNQLCPELHLLRERRPTYTQNSYPVSPAHDSATTLFLFTSQQVSLSILASTGHWWAFCETSLESVSEHPIGSSTSQNNSVLQVECQGLKQANGGCERAATHLFLRPSTKLRKLKSKYLLAPSKLFVITKHPELSGEFSQSSFIFCLVTGVLEDQSQEDAHQLILVTRSSPLHSQWQLSFQTIWLQYLISKHSFQNQEWRGGLPMEYRVTHRSE